MNNNANPVVEAKTIARKAIERVYETALEVDEPTEEMYEFDAIVIDDGECPVGEIAIMHDDEKELYALVERVRPNTALIHEAEKAMRIGDLLQQIELKVMMLSMACETEGEIVAAWGALSASTSSTMRFRLHELGFGSDWAM